MNDYIEARLTFEPCNEDITDLAAAFLAEAGFESFVADDSELTAYRPTSLGPLPDVETLLDGFPFDVETTMTAVTVEGRDWNAEWERNYFKPIVVGDQCVVHSSFHTDIPRCRYDIVIDPKMAFGTGHHATTEQMMRRVLAADLEGKSVVDMGTGTGILAILAAMRGATQVTGIEIDPAAHANAVENVALNAHPEIRLILGDATALEGIAGVDMFLANINRNIITADINRYAATLRPGGEMMLSGFYEADVDIIRRAGEAAGMAYADHTTLNDWACVRLVKS